MYKSSWYNKTARAFNVYESSSKGSEPNHDGDNSTTTIWYILKYSLSA